MLEFFKKLPLIAQIIIVVVIVVILIIIINAIRKKIKENKAHNLIENNVQTTITGGSYNVGKATVEIYQAFHKDWWQEDEKLASQIILETPKELIPKLKNTYFLAFGKNLTEECTKYLDEYYPLVKNHLA